MSRNDILWRPKRCDSSWWPALPGKMRHLVTPILATTRCRILLTNNRLAVLAPPALNAVGTTNPSVRGQPKRGHARFVVQGNRFCRRAIAFSRASVFCGFSNGLNACLASIPSHHSEGIRLKVASFCPFVPTVNCEDP